VMARFLFDPHRLIGGAGDWHERGGERERSQAATKHYFLRLLDCGLNGGRAVGLILPERLAVVSPRTKKCLRVSHFADMVPCPGTLLGLRHHFRGGALFPAKRTRLREVQTPRAG